MVVAVAVIALLIWYLFGLILIVFGAVILAMLLRLGAQPFMRWLSMPEPLALSSPACLCCRVIGGTGYLFGTRISDEFQDVLQRATSASAAIQSSLRGSDFGNFLLQHFSGDGISVTGVLSGVLRVSTSFLEAFIIMIISGIYLAAQPRLYRKGLIWLFPPAKHARAAEIIDGVGEALRLWLLGQLIQMVLIGALVIVCRLADRCPLFTGARPHRRHRRIHSLSRADPCRHSRNPGCAHQKS